MAVACSSAVCHQVRQHHGRWTKCRTAWSRAGKPGQPARRRAATGASRAGTSTARSRMEARCIGAAQRWRAATYGLAKVTFLHFLTVHIFSDTATIVRHLERSFAIYLASFQLMSFSLNISRQYWEGTSRSPLHHNVLRSSCLHRRRGLSMKRNA